MDNKRLLHELGCYKQIPVREIADAIGFSPAQLGRWIDGSSIPLQGVERHHPPRSRELVGTSKPNPIKDTRWRRYMKLRAYDESTTLQYFLDSIQEMILTGEITQSDLLSPFGLEDYRSFSLVKDSNANISIGYDDDELKYVIVPFSDIPDETEFIEETVSRGTSEEG